MASAPEPRLVVGQSTTARLALAFPRRHLVHSASMTRVATFLTYAGCRRHSRGKPEHDRALDVVVGTQTLASLSVGQRRAGDACR